MYDRCKRDKIKYSDYDIIIKESWAKFIEYYLLEDIYKKDGHTIWEYRIYDYTFGQEIPNNRTYGIIPHISQDIRYLMRPHDSNAQGYDLSTWNSDLMERSYTPVFIDLLDDSNQKEYYRLFMITDKTLPDDRIFAKCDHKYIEELMYRSKDIVQLKNNILLNLNRLNIAEDVVNDYFSFYGI